MGPATLRPSRSSASASPCGAGARPTLERYAATRRAVTDGSPRFTDPCPRCHGVEARPERPTPALHPLAEHRTASSLDGLHSLGFGDIDGAHRRCRWQRSQRNCGDLSPHHRTSRNPRSGPDGRRVRSQLADAASGAPGLSAAGCALCVSLEGLTRRRERVHLDASPPVRYGLIVKDNVRLWQEADEAGR